MAQALPATAPTADQHKRWRAMLMKKGMEINGQLTKLLAGQNATLATLKLPNEDKGGEPKELKLRRYLNQVIAAQRRLDSPEWGVCQECGAPLPAAVFDEAPWTDSCQTCAAQEQSGLPF